MIGLEWTTHDQPYTVLTLTALAWQVLLARAVRSSVLSTTEASPCCPGKQTEPLAVADGIAGDPRGGWVTRARARVWEFPQCPQSKSRHVALETKVNP